MPFMLPDVPLSAPGGMGLVEVTPLVVVLPMLEAFGSGMLGLEVTAGSDVALEDLGMSVDAPGMVGVRVVGDVVVVVVGEVVVVVLDDVGVSAGVVPEVVAGVVAGVVMGVDGGVVAEFCASAKPAPPTTAITAADAIKN
jgi:hypothetical protein